MIHQLNFSHLRDVVDELYRDLAASPSAEARGLARDILARRVLTLAQDGETDPATIKSLAMRGLAGPYLKFSRDVAPELPEYSLDLPEAVGK